MFDAIAEERIAEAIRRGEFDNLPGAGKPLAFDDDALVPEEVRVVYRILRNAGYVPPEVIERRELAALEAALPTLTDAGERSKALTKLALLRTRLGAKRGSQLTTNRLYTRRIIEKLAGGGLST
jgi:hypothetical protein